MIDERTEDKETEIIAEKSRKAAYVFLALTALGVAVAAAGVILYFVAGYKTVKVGIQAAVIVLTALGAVLIAVFTLLFIKQLYRKYSLIILKEGELTFPDGTVCTPNEITAVEKCKNKITLTVRGEKKEIDGVANVDKAYRKLCVLTGNTVSE
ncbi:MAG: hypothetical protein K2K04_04115 [Clostridia bacterium]|nr:hypothetical protein [Clostridia bacterium]